jgi:protein-disulfide isomerase
MTRDEATKQAKAYRGSVIQTLATLLHAANDLAPEDDPDKYDAWRALVMRARNEHDALARLAREEKARADDGTEGR